MTWTHSIRSGVFARLPKSWQPVANYHYYRLRSQLERELPLVCRVLRPGCCAVDVGANEGVYTHAFARTGARVEAFEPLPQCLDVLRSYQRVHSAVSVHEEALGSADCWATLHVPMRGGLLINGRASLDAGASSGEGSGADFPVKVRTLDSFALPKVDLIKIDVEGREADVIRGALETIAMHRPVLLVEIEQRHQTAPIRSVFDLIAGLGYSGRFVHPQRGVLRIDEFDAATHQAPRNADTAGAFYINNFIFTPADAADTPAFLGR